MNTYDLYLFSGEKNLVVGWHRFDAPEDGKALEIAAGLVLQPPAELWKSDSLVRRWDVPAPTA